LNHAIAHATSILHAGGLIAYPTEAVYGLGCDPLNHAACERLFTLKQRSPEQGVLLIAAAFEQIAHFIDSATPTAAIERACATWPGPYTWVFPRASCVPDWISGAHPTIALRITAHPLAAQLCRSFGGALVSTSANRHGEAPARNAAQVHAYFDQTIDLILEGAVGTLEQPTTIQDALTGATLRN